MNNGLETCRLGKFLFDMFDGWHLTYNELRNAIQILDANGNGISKIDLMILKKNDNDFSDMNSEVNK
jgi:hypothetical protein